MNSGAKALLIVGGIWIALFVAGHLAGEANEQRDREHPMITAVSESSKQTYFVFALFDRERFAGFDLESTQVRFANCDLPPAGDVDQDAPETICMDSTGKRWRISL